MYWLREGNLLSFFLWGAVLWAAWLGGWLIATHAFRLEPRERLVAGLGLGLCDYLWLANVLGHWLDSRLAFSAAGLLILAAGLGLGRLSARQGRRPLLEWRDWQAWPTLLAVLILAGWFTFVGKGLAIFDEPKNLTLISRMAANDIPPHYYLNSGFYFRYHYGFQLLGASLVSLGDLFPWSAFDLSKGIVFGLSVALIGLVGRRLVDHPLAGWVTAAVFTLASGTRYLLQFIPQSWLAQADTAVTLIGTSENMAVPFSQSLTQTWTLDGGPPSPFLFGYLNGIFPALTMAHAGSYALSIGIMALLILLITRTAHRAACVVLAVLLAFWGLVWESSYGLFMLGGAAASLYLAWKQRRSLLSPPSLSLLLSVPLVLWQGGTITEIARQLLLQAANSGIGVEGQVTAAGFSLRWPPAVLSSHLGALNIFSPLELLIAVCELGPVFLLAPWITAWAWKRLRTGEWISGALIISAWIGLAAPLCLEYQAERDLSRLTGYSLGVWTLLLIIFVWSKRDQWRTSLLFWVGTLSLALVLVGGIVTTAIEMSALASPPTHGLGIEGLDSRMSGDLWNRLPAGDEIFDADGWRASVLTGLPTHAAIGQDPLPAWKALQQAPTVEALLANHYRYVYVDDFWWKILPKASKASLSEPCVEVLVERWDDDQRHFRRLLDLQGCAAE